MCQGPNREREREREREEKAKGREIGGFADFRNAVEAGPKSNGKWKLKRPLNDDDDGYDLAPEILQNIIKVLLL